MTEVFQLDVRVVESIHEEIRFRRRPKMNLVISVSCGMMVMPKQLPRHKMWTESLGGSMSERDNATQAI
jgi:hypothetical protein